MSDIAHVLGAVVGAGGAAVDAHDLAKKGLSKSEKASLVADGAGGLNSAADHGIKVAAAVHSVAGGAGVAAGSVLPGVGAGLAAAKGAADLAIRKTYDRQIQFIDAQLKALDPAIYPAGSTRRLFLETQLQYYKKLKSGTSMAIAADAASAAGSGAAFIPIAGTIVSIVCATAAGLLTGGQLVSNSIGEKQLKEQLSKLVETYQARHQGFVQNPALLTGRVEGAASHLEKATTRLERLKDPAQFEAVIAELEATGFLPQGWDLKPGLLGPAKGGIAFTHTDKARPIVLEAAQKAYEKAQKSFVEAQKSLEDYEAYREAFTLLHGKKYQGRLHTLLTFHEKHSDLTLTTVAAVEKQREIWKARYDGFKSAAKAAPTEALRAELTLKKRQVKADLRELDEYEKALTSFRQKGPGHMFPRYVVWQVQQYTAMSQQRPLQGEERRAYEFLNGLLGVSAPATPAPTSPAPRNRASSSRPPVLRKPAALASPTPLSPTSPSSHISPLSPRSARPVVSSPSPSSPLSSASEE